MVKTKLSNPAILSFLIKPTHPDYDVLVSQSVDARRLFNSLNAVARESYSYRKDNNSDTHISKSLGLLDWVQANPNLALVYGYESNRKVIETQQGIHLPQKIAQRVGVSVANAWKSYYGLKKVNPDANPPRFKQKYGLVEYTKQAISRNKSKTGYIIPSGWSHGVRLPDHIDTTTVQSARLLHSHGQVFKLEVIYLKKEPSIVSPTSLTAGIDLGVDTLAMVAYSDTSIRPLRVDGREIKSINAYYNKQIATLTSKYDKEVNNIRIKNPELDVFKIRSHRAGTLWAKRDRKIKHLLHTASATIIKALSRTGVDTLVIGWSTGFKQGMAMGKRNNQNFAYLPLAKFRDMLKYKAEQAGLRVLLQEESYTSKSSFLDNDPLPVYGEIDEKPKFSGRRVTRGQYRSSTGSVIHADVNGALNILRKSKQPMRLCNGIIVMPQRLSITH
jgi:putative transposase